MRSTNTLFWKKFLYGLDSMLLYTLTNWRKTTGFLNMGHFFGKIV